MTLAPPKTPREYVELSGSHSCINAVLKAFDGTVVAVSHTDDGIYITGVSETMFIKIFLTSSPGVGSAADRGLTAAQLYTKAELHDQGSAEAGEVTVVQTCDIKASTKANVHVRVNRGVYEYKIGNRTNVTIRRSDCKVARVPAFSSINTDVSVVAVKSRLANAISDAHEGCGRTRRSEAPVYVCVIRSGGAECLAFLPVNLSETGAVVNARVACESVAMDSVTPVRLESGEKVGEVSRGVWLKRLQLFTLQYLCNTPRVGTITVSIGQNIMKIQCATHQTVLQAMLVTPARHPGSAPPPIADRVAQTAQQLAKSVSSESTNVMPHDMGGYSVQFPLPSRSLVMRHADREGIVTSPSSSKRPPSVTILPPLRRQPSLAIGSSSSVSPVVISEGLAIRPHQQLHPTTVTPSLSTGTSDPRVVTQKGIQSYFQQPQQSSPPPPPASSSSSSSSSSKKQRRGTKRKRPIQKESDPPSPEKKRKKARTGPRLTTSVLLGPALGQPPATKAPPVRRRRSEMKKKKATRSRHRGKSTRVSVSMFARK